MDFDAGILKREERLILELRSLYHRHGYLQYKMSKFEEYDLYVRNKDFLMSREILTFTDTNGRLMALKPDVTLSIVRNARPTPGSTEKVYYDESVYRVSRGSRGFREIRQLGLECIGAVDDYCVGEVLSLAAETLRRISPRHRLNISHLGILRALLSFLPEEDREQALKLIGEKNAHELRSCLRSCGAEPEQIERLCSLIGLCGEPEEILPRLEALCGSSEALRELRGLVDFLRAEGYSEGVTLDFSVCTDMNYYNGVVFRGFVEGAPAAVLSGGEYDHLLKKMGKSGRAVGFAACMDQLELLDAREREYDVDVLLLYDEHCAPEAVAAAVRALQTEGKTVAAQRGIPEKLRYREVKKLEESGAMRDGND